LEFLNFHIIEQFFLFQRWASKHNNLLKSIWTNKTQNASEFSNFHIIVQSFTSLTDCHRNIITYWKANGQIKLRLRWYSWILILLYRVFLFLRMISKYYLLLKSIWTNKTQVALEFLNFHIIVQIFTFFNWLTSKHYNLLKSIWTNKTRVALKFLNFHIIEQIFLFQRWTSKHYNLLKSNWTNKTQVALEFLNFHIIVQDFLF
jgi:hypothetical protein